MQVLTMRTGLRPALDGELGAAVEAAQACGALLRRPNGTVILHLDRANGAFARAKPAADALLPPP